MGKTSYLKFSLLFMFSPLMHLHLPIYVLITMPFYYVQCEYIVKCPTLNIFSLREMTNK